MLLAAFQLIKFYDISRNKFEGHNFEQYVSFKVFEICLIDWLRGNSKFLFLY